METNFETFIGKTISHSGADILRKENHVRRLSDDIFLIVPEDHRMVMDMARGNVFALYLDETDGAHEKAFQILKKAGHSETEINEYLDSLEKILKEYDLHAETDNDRMLKEADDDVFGRDVTQDYEKAARLYNDAARDESPRGKYVVLMSAVKNEINDLSNILDGEAVKEKISPERYARFTPYVDPVKGDGEVVELLKECAEDNVPEAQYLLGRCYGLKEGESFVTEYLKPDKEKAAEWIHRAEENGFTLELSEEEQRDALINAKPMDVEKLKEIAEEGYAEAQIRYAETFPVEEDERWFWMQKAADQKNVTAVRKLAQLYQEKNDNENYIAWLVKGSDLNDPDAMYLLGCEFLRSENDDGTRNPNYDEITGVDLLESSAFWGNKDASDKLDGMEDYPF